jgi:hypothetical protein
VPRAELACWRAGCDGEFDGCAAGQSRIKIPVRADRLHVPPGVVVEEFACGGRTTWYGPRLGRRWRVLVRRRRVLVRTSWLSYKTETCREAGTDRAEAETGRRSFL